MRVAFVVAALALIACTFVAAQSAEVAPRFAQAEVEDSAVLAEQQKAFEESLDETQIEDEAEAEDEAEDESEADEEAEDETEEESEEEADEESEEEADEEADDENEEEADEESEEEADEESEDESEEESEADESQFVLAELADNAVSTGFMEMTATFKPVDAVEAHHVVHSLASHQLAVAAQEYSNGYAHGHSDAKIAAAPAAAEEEESEESFVEAGANADSEHAPLQYIASNGQPYFASYPAHVASVQPYYGGVPMPPQLPTWLPPPPYITPVAPAEKGGEEF